MDRAIIAGTYSGSLSNGGETIKIEDAGNGTIQEFQYEDGRDGGEETWHPTTDGDGYSLVIRDPLASLTAWSSGAAWRASVLPGGSPGTADGQAPDADFDDDGDVDADDLDLLSIGVRSSDQRFDLNQDGVADAADRNLMISQLLGTNFGDSNLDGVFNSNDLVLVFSAGEYEDDVAGNSGWSDGDWNGDGDFDTSDMIAVFSAGGFTYAAVPASRPISHQFDPSWWDHDLRLRRERLVDAIWADNNDLLTEGIIANRLTSNVPFKRPMRTTIGIS